jgi:hypothetical protein
MHRKTAQNASLLVLLGRHTSHTPDRLACALSPTQGYLSLRMSRPRHSLYTGILAGLQGRSVIALKRWRQPGQQGRPRYRCGWGRAPS